MFGKKSLHTILSILSATQRRKYRSFFWLSLFFSLLDILSVATLVPFMLLVLDKEKLLSLMTQYGFDDHNYSFVAIEMLIFILIFFFILKNLFQTRFSTRLFDFLYDTAHEISLSCATAFLTGNYLDFQKENKGIILQRVMKVATDFTKSILFAVLLLASEAVVFGVIVLFMIYLYPQVTLLAIGGLLFFSVAIFLMKNRQMTLINTTYKKSYAKANAKLINILDGYLEIKSSGNKDYFINEFGKHNRQLNRVTGMLTSSNFNYSKYLELALVFCLCGLVYMAANTDSNRMTILVSVLAAISIKVLPSLSRILGAVTLFKSHFYTVDVLGKIKPIIENERVLSDFNQTIQFDQISFGYENPDDLFKEVNFTLEAGNMIGIKGYSGSGKTSFLYLIMGTLLPTQGRILVDGQPIEGSHFYSFVSYVPQQPFLFEGTLLENITMGQPIDRVDRKRIAFLCHELQLDKVISRFPEGIDAEVNHNSMQLSGGQKQRISIVRALYNKPRLLVLDEATNQQNTELKLVIFKFLKHLTQSEQLTVILVSHEEMSDMGFDAVYKVQDRTLFMV